jgi:hypothetical protein
MSDDVRDADAYWRLRDVQQEVEAVHRLLTRMSTQLSTVVNLLEDWENGGFPQISGEPTTKRDSDL